MRRSVDFIHNIHIGTAAVAMTGDEVLNMHDNPIEVVPAPSGQMMIVPLACTTQWVAGTASFVAEAPGLYYGSNDGGALAITFGLAALDGLPPRNEIVTDVADSNCVPTDVAQNAPLFVTDSAPLSLVDTNNPPDGELFVHVQYAIVPLYAP